MPILLKVSQVSVLRGHNSVDRTAAVVREKLP
jgi:hypothetical protein